MSNEKEWWDDALETSVVGSFTSLGYNLRRRQWDPIPDGSLSERTVLITGATSGIGKIVARRTAELGARLRIIARNAEKVEAVRDELISATGNEDIDYYLADLSLMSDVAEVSNAILNAEQSIHVLINNAVILPAERTMTAEGLELSHATNLVAPFLLTNSLLDRIVDSAPARVINVISGGMYAQGLALDDLNNQEGDYSGSVAYARAKRGLMVLTKMWADQLAGTGVTVNATHPGWVDTPGLKESLPGFYRVMRRAMRTPEQGSDTIVWLAAAEDGGVESGELWHDRAVRTEYRFKKTIETAADRNELWKQLSDTVGALT